MCSCTWYKISLIGCVLLLASCANRSPNDRALFDVVYEGLKDSKRTIAQANESIMVQLKQKAFERATAQKAALWLPKALLAEHYRQEIDTVLEQTKRELVGHFKGNGQDVAIVYDFFVRLGKGKALYNKLKAYELEMLRIDPRITSDLQEHLTFPTSPNKNYKDAESFTSFLFGHTSLPAFFALLEQFENSTAIIENKVIAYCRMQIVDPIEEGTRISTVVSQSSAVVSAGESLEIMAGVAMFTKRVKPVIFINGRPSAIREDGSASVKIQAPKKEGAYSVPIRMVRR